MSETQHDTILAAIEPAGAACKLVLRNGVSLLVNVSAEGLNAHMTNHGVTIPGESRVEVYYKPMQMNEREWRLISALLRAHPEAAETLGRYKQINLALRRSFVDICELPYRIYSGISSKESPSLYLSHPFDFYPKNGGHYCLLSERSMVIKCSVNYKRYSVTLEEGELPGHFVQG